MKHISKAIIFGFKEILNWHTMKYIIISGIAVTLFWGIVGFALWDYIINLGAKVVELVPFSMIRSNGAWMLSTFLWFQLTLVTFALFFAFFGNLILRKVSRDNYAMFSFLTLLASALFWGVVWFFKGDYIYNQFLKLMTWLPFETIDKSIAFLIGFYIIYNAIVVSVLFFTSIFSEVIVKDIEKREFANDDIVRDNIFKTVKFTIKDSIIFAILSILALPLLFVPIVNILVQIILWIWLVKNTIGYD
ncbi:MAG: hypothetical protein GXO30_03155, partial [Epsilonproteobacteria bacterium]|nr:hypothetical protein [Campylobacterota bacterium]